MNFYLCDINGSFRPEADNAYVSDSFVDYLFRTRNMLDFSLDALFDIDPYETVRISNPYVLHNEILDLLKRPTHDVFKKYPDMIAELEKLSSYLNDAIQNNRLIVSVGD